LLDHFGWTRAQLSLLQTTLALSAGLVVPLVGWLLDRLEARVLIVAGAAATGIGFLLASRADAFVPMVVAYVLIGLGLGAARPLVLADRPRPVLLCLRGERHEPARHPVLHRHRLRRRARRALHEPGARDRGSRQAGDGAAGGSDRRPASARAELPALRVRHG